MKTPALNRLTFYFRQLKKQLHQRMIDVIVLVPGTQYLILFRHGVMATHAILGIRCNQSSGAIITIVHESFRLNGCMVRVCLSGIMIA